MRVIIIGGGPAGLAAALRFQAAHGAEVSVYEVRQEPTTLGGAVQLPPNGLRLMDQLGLSDLLNERGFRSSKRHIHSMQGELLADIDRNEEAGDTSGFGFMRIMRKDLLDVLLDSTSRRGIPVNFGKHLTGVDESDCNVTVTFSDGSSDTGDVVFGADGIHSAVRRLHVDPHSEPIYSGVANLLGILATADLEPANNNLEPALHATKTPDGLIGLSPCTTSGDQLYWFFSRAIELPNGDSREGWEAKGREVDMLKAELLDVLREAEGSWGGRLRDVIRKTHTLKLYPIFKMPPNCKWSSKRCILLGDAAHAMQPHVGQGTSMALEDVFWLSRLLDDVNRPLADVFAHFERVRRPRVEELSQAAADRGRARTTAANGTPSEEKGAAIELARGAVSYDIMKEPLPLVG